MADKLADALAIGRSDREAFLRFARDTARGQLDARAAADARDGEGGWGYCT